METSIKSHPGPLPKGANYTVPDVWDWDKFEYSPLFEQHRQAAQGPSNVTTMASGATGPTRRRLLAPASDGVPDGVLDPMLDPDADDATRPVDGGFVAGGVLVEDDGIIMATAGDDDGDASKPTTTSRTTKVLDVPSAVPGSSIQQTNADEPATKLTQKQGNKGTTAGVSVTTGASLTGNSARDGRASIDGRARVSLLETDPPPRVKFVPKATGIKPQQLAGGRTPMEEHEYWSAKPDTFVWGKVEPWEIPENSGKVGFVVCG